MKRPELIATDFLAILEVFKERKKFLNATLIINITYLFDFSCRIQVFMT